MPRCLLQGWVDAIPYIKTKYSYLVHNDGYALDAHFGCELLRGLQHHQVSAPPVPLPCPQRPCYVTWGW